MKQFEHTPVFLVARALQKAGTVAKLAKEIRVGESTIYFWLNMDHGLSRPSVEALTRYLEAPEPAPATRAQRRPEPSNAREEMHPMRVFLVRHALSRDSRPIIFAENGDGEQVFMPPIVAEQAFARYGANGVLPYDTPMNVTAYKDRSGRSAYIAYAVTE